jgi:cell pole-organizing protein PopZ
MMRKMLCALALLLGLGMASAPARAQETDHHAAMMRHHRDLGLSPAQEQRMEAIHASLATTMRAHCERVRAAGGPNAQTHAAMHTEMQQAMETAHREAMAVLTTAQRARLDSVAAQHHGAGGNDRAAHAGHAMPAEHAAHDSTHAGMAAMHGEMHGGMCSKEGMDCCATPAAATTRPGG